MEFITTEVRQIRGINRDSLSHIGSTLNFELLDGQKVQAVVVKVVGSTATLLHVDLLNKEYWMNPTNTTRGGYRDCELRRILNTEILNLYPEEIRRYMVPFQEEECQGDLITIPCEADMFGDNPSFPMMRRRRNRMSCGKKENGEIMYWYWLRDVVSSTIFAYVTTPGNAYYDSASNASGVRPAFQISLI